MIVCCGTSFFRGGCDATLFLGSYGWSASLYVCVDRRRCIRTGGGGLLFEGDGVPAPFNQACTTPCTLAGIASWTEMGWETVPYTYDTFDWVWDPSLVWFDFFGNQYIGAYEYRTVTHTGMMTLPVTVTLVQPIYSKCPAVQTQTICEQSSANTGFKCDNGDGPKDCNMGTMRVWYTDAACADGWSFPSSASTTDATGVRNVCGVTYTEATMTTVTGVSCGWVPATRTF